MKTAFVGAVMIGSLLLPVAYGQRGGAGMAPSRGATSGFGWRAPRPGVEWPAGRPGDFLLNNRFPVGFGGYTYGNLYPFWGGFDGYDDLHIIQTPPVVVVAMPPVPEPPPAPPPRANPVLHEYSWPAAGQSSAASFAIASKDGVVRFAAAVWFQNGMLLYKDPNGSDGRLDLAAVDGEATRRLNAERGLTLQIPIP